MPSQQTIPSAQIEDAPVPVLPMEVFGYRLVHVSGRRKQSSCRSVRQKTVEVIVVIDRLRAGVRSVRSGHGLIVTNPGRTGNAFAHGCGADREVLSRRDRAARTAHKGDVRVCRHRVMHSDGRTPTWRRREGPAAPKRDLAASPRHGSSYGTRGSDLRTLAMKVIPTV